MMARRDSNGIHMTIGRKIGYGFFLLTLLMALPLLMAYMQMEKAVGLAHDLKRSEAAFSDPCMAGVSMMASQLQTTQKIVAMAGLTAFVLAILMGAFLTKGIGLPLKRFGLQMNDAVTSLKNGQTEGIHHLERLLSDFERLT